MMPPGGQHSKRSGESESSCFVLGGVSGWINPLWSEIFPLNSVYFKPLGFLKQYIPQYSLFSTIYNVSILALQNKVILIIKLVFMTHKTASQGSNLGVCLTGRTFQGTTTKRMYIFSKYLSTSRKQQPQKKSHSESRASNSHVIFSFHALYLTMV